MSENMKGITAMLMSAIGFITNDAIVKLITAELPNGEIIFLRGLVATSIMGLICSILGGWRSPRVLLQGAMLTRLIAAASATLFVVASLRHLPLANINAILQVGPLLVTAGAAILLGAHVGWRRWVASCIGFAGALLIIKPGTSAFVPAIWLALACLMSSSTRDLATRFVDRSVPSIFVTFAASAMVMMAGLGLAPFETWIVPSPHALTLIMAT
ncbi:MAG: DMT family transporter, partial [Hyphomicrobiaceae bacterium]